MSSLPGSWKRRNYEKNSHFEGFLWINLTQSNEVVDQQEKVATAQNLRTRESHEKQANNEMESMMDRPTKMPYGAAD